MSGFVRNIEEAFRPGRGFWNEIGDGVNVRRLRDRVFIGAGADSSGNKFQTERETWLTSDLGAYWLERGAQTLSVSTFGQFGGMFASRTSDQELHDYGTASIGVAGVAVNDRADGTGLAWGGYFEVNRQASTPAGSGTSFGVELAVKNNGEDVTNGAYNKFPGGATIGAWFAGGGDGTYNGMPEHPCTAAIVIGKNATTWNKGIVFDAIGITGTDGATGTGIAIEMAKGHVVKWVVSDGSNGAAIYSDVSARDKDVSLYFANDTLQLRGHNGAPIARFFQNGAVTPANADSLNFYNGPGGGANGLVQILASGASATVDLKLAMQGGGVLRYGTFKASTDVAIVGYISIKDDAGNPRKLAVIA